MKPTPDPTELTTDALGRGLASERDYVNGQVDVLKERLRGIDIATKVLNETVNRTPTDIQKEITHLRELTYEKFRSIEVQFAERDTRSERESRDNKTAVDAAFAASKEAASEQNKSNTLAISKSETSTSETITKLAELFKSSNEALADKIDDVKSRQDRMEAAKIAATATVHETRDSSAATRAAIGFGITAILFVVTISGFLIALLPRTQ